MRRVVVTGASSMLGIAFINECLSNNIQVVAVVRENSKKANIIPKSSLITIVECDLKNIKNLEINTICKCDTLYHLAWSETSNKGRDNISSQIQNIHYIKDVVEFAYKIGCKTFIGAGSQAEYGRSDLEILTNSECNPETAYGVAKYAAGKLSSIQCESLRMRHIWTRIFSVYGPYNNEETMIMYCIKKMLKGERPSLTKCEQIWDYLYSEDAARALFLLGVKGKDKKIYNIASGISKPLINYIEQIRDLINPNLELGIGEIDYGNKQVMKLSTNIDDLTRDTGFIPSFSFKEGICKTIEWTRNK